MKKSHKRYEHNKSYLKKNRQETSFNKYEAENGLTILTEEIPGVESVAISITVNAGSRDDFKGKEGLAHFMEHIAYRHTKTKSSRQIAEGFESVGAYTNAFTTQEHTCFYVRTLSRHFKKTLRLLADITLNPIFRKKDIEKERTVILEEIKSGFDDPEEYIFDIGDKVLFGNNPLGNPILGYEETVSKIYFEDLVEYHSKYYQPSNIVITAAGNISHNKVIKTVMEIFKNKKNIQNISERNSQGIPLKAETYKETQDISQAHILFGKIISSYKSEERYPIMLLNTLLGDGMSSRLYQRIREKYGFAYNIYSIINHYSDCGTIYIYTATEKSKVKLSEDLIFNELKKLSEKISLSNLRKAKEQLKSGIIMELENLTSRMTILAKNYLFINGRESTEEIINSINSVKIEDINSVAKKYLNTSNWNKIYILPKD